MYSSVVVVNPAYPARRKRFYGMVNDPVNPGTVRATMDYIVMFVALAAMVPFFAWLGSLAWNPTQSDSAAESEAWLGIWLLILLFGVMFLAPRVGKKLIASQQRKARLRVQANGFSSERAVLLVGQTQADAIRFGRMIAKQPGLAVLGRPTSQSLAWVVWNAAQRAKAVRRLEAELSQAGTRATGPAKAAWLADQNDKITQLSSPIASAAAEVHELADLAEDTVWAARLALEAPGTPFLPTLTGADVAAPANISEAMVALRAWHTTWIELDEQLRAARHTR